MFRIVLRIVLALLVGAPLVWAWQYAMGPVIDTFYDIAGQDAVTVGYFETVVLWFPMLALFMLLIYGVAGALEARGQTGRPF